MSEKTLHVESEYGVEVLHPFYIQLRVDPSQAQVGAKRVKDLLRKEFELTLDDPQTNVALERWCEKLRQEAGE